MDNHQELEAASSSSTSSSDDEEDEDWWFRQVYVIAEVAAAAHDHNGRVEAGQPEDNLLYNKDGSIRKRRRALYERSYRRVTRRENPWERNCWLLLIRNPNVNNPRHIKGECIQI